MILQFFRNPTRKTIIDPNKIIAPVDGKVVIIKEVFEKEYFKKKKLHGLNIKVIDTGNNCLTGGRVYKLKKYINDEFRYNDEFFDIFKKILEIHLNNNNNINNNNL